MNVPYEALAAVPANIVYVRPVAVADLPDEIRAQAGELHTIYALHRPDGERVALVANRSMAFALARDNEMVPVSVN